MLVTVNLPYAYFALVVENDIVVRCAPIAKWSIGKKIENVIDYYKQKGGVVTIIK